ncbi:hypothetical protein GGX14DRAFT_656676 [Mycena pura]|uniref:C2H2-type domain-containing protein n=1 Tax=Mycena pura TaxID=153505 RepID=A0AAD6Y7Y3_9AGAR|nr:hypothetical protein GGX14DRAFT_656676 [Mycena pura]
MAYFGEIQNIGLQERRDRFDAVNSEEQQENPNRRVRFKAALRNAIGDDPAKAQEELDAWLNSLQSRHNPLTLKHIENTIEIYASTVAVWSPQIPRRNYWLEEVVKKHAPASLLYYARLAKGTGGRDHIKASTLVAFTNRFITQIAFRTHSENGDKPAPLSLIECSASLELALDRQANEKLVYGDLELLLIIQTALSDSTPGPTRLSKIHNIFALLLLFFTGLRPGSLGPSHPKFLKEGKYPRLKQLQIERSGVLEFRTKLRITDLKGYFGVVGAKVVFNLSSPKLWSNVILDINLYLMVYLTERGALEGISSIEDLIADERSELRIKPEMGDEPLFCKMGPGGRAFDVSAPIMAQSISKMSTGMASAAGLVGGSGYCYRRNAGNVVAHVLGKEAAEMLLCHKRQGSLHNYQVQITNMDLTPLMTGERRDYISPVAETALQLQRMDSPAISTILLALHSEVPRRLLQMQNASTLAPEGDISSAAAEATQLATEISTKRPTRNDLSKEELKEIEATPALAALIQDSHRAIESYKALFTDYRGVGKATTLGAMTKYAEFSTLRDEADEQKAKEELEAMRALGISITKMRTRLKIQKAAAKKKAALKAQTQSGQSLLSFPGSVKDRQSVRDSMATAPANLMNSILAHPDSARATSATTVSAPTVSAPTVSAPRFTSATSATTSAASTLSASTLSASTLSVTTSATTSATQSAASASTADLHSEAGSLPVLDTTNLLSFFDEHDDIQVDPAQDFDQNKTLQMISDQADRSRGSEETLKRAEQLQQEAVQLPDDGLIDRRVNGLTIVATEGGDVSVDVPAVDAPAADLPADNAVHVVEARKAFVDFLVRPLKIEKVVNECKVSGGYRCQKCRLYTHDPKACDRVFKRRNQLIRHLDMQHSEWEDLVVAARQENEKGEYSYHCTKCDFSSKKMPLLRKHCRERCIEQEYFEALHLDDQALKVRLSGKSKGPAQKSRIFEEITRLQRLEEDLVEFAAAVRIFALIYTLHDSLQRGHADEMREFFKDLLYVKTALPSEEEIEKELNGEYDSE